MKSTSAITIGFLLSLSSSPAWAASFNLIVPQQPGGGTSIWAEVVAEELDKFLEEDVIITHIPGSRDQIGFEKFFHDMKDDPMAVMISHGGNAVSFLQEDVTYDYRLLAPVAQMSNDIVVSRRTGQPGTEYVFSEQSGSVPEALALAMLAGWESVRYVKGMNSGDARLAFRRGELNTIRENPLAHHQYMGDLIATGEAAVWFVHGTYDGSGFVADDNFPDAPTFQALYEETHGTPAAEHALFPAYELVTAWRDGLQKAVWVHPDNPNREKLVAAFAAMLSDPVSRARLDEELGVYPWRIGGEGDAFLEKLFGLVSEDALTSLVAFNKDALALEAILRPQLYAAAQ